MKAIFEYEAIRFDGTNESAFEVAKFTDGAEMTLRYERYPANGIVITLRPTVDYVDWGEITLEAGDVLVKKGVGQRIVQLKGKHIDQGSYPYITFEE